MNFVKQPDGSWLARGDYAFGVWLEITPRRAGLGCLVRVFVGDTKEIDDPLSRLIRGTLVATADTHHAADSLQARAEAIRTFKRWSAGILIQATTDGHGNTLIEI